MEMLQFDIVLEDRPVKLTHLCYHLCDIQEISLLCRRYITGHNHKRDIRIETIHGRVRAIIKV